MRIIRIAILLSRSDLTYLLTFALAIVAMTSCEPVIPHTDSDTDKVLAQVYDQKLTLGQVRPLLIDIASEEDSVSQVRNHVETWVRETLLLQEAARNIPNEVNINKLVQDYRASLLISNYENVLAKTLLDTVVTEAELRAYYERNKMQFQLDGPILRCHYIRLKKPLAEKQYFDRIWRSERPADFDDLQSYCKAFAAEFLLQDSTWYRQPDVERMLPQGSLTGQNMSPGRTFRFSDNEYEYHLRIIQRVAAKEFAPLSYVTERARRFILHKRKIDLLEKIKADIYEREIKGDNVKIHI